MHPNSSLLTIALLASLLAACDGSKLPYSSTEVAARGAQGAALSDDGQWAIIGSIHHGGSLWRTADGERLYNWNHKQGEQTTIIAADFSPDGQWAMTADVHTLVLWNLQNGEGSRFWTAPGEVLSIALSSGGNYALLGLSDHSAVVFDVKRGGVRRTFSHENRVRSVDLSEDGSLALTGSEDYTAVLWDMSSGEELQRIKHEDDVQMVAISPDGSTALSAAKYDKALVWKTDSRKILGEVPLASEKLKRGLRFTSARFSHDGKRLLTGRPDQVVQLWDTSNMTQLNRWKLPKRDAWKPTGSAVLAVAFGETDGTYHAVASNGFIHKLKRQ